MFIDARSIDDGADIDCDVCIVGAGPAGITIARELDAGGARVCLLESGGLKAEEDTQSLYEGESVGGRYKADRIEPRRAVASTRLRFFGGTTNHWGGWSRPLDEIDFEERPAVPGSGWPIDRAELEPYYARAQKVCDLGPARYDAAYWARHTGKQLLPVPRPLVSQVYQVPARIRFAEIHREGLRRSRRVRVILHANAVRLAAAADATRIERVRVATLTGRRFDVSARRFVLAAGGIENARLLLASNDVRPRGIGNERDLVGRYFGDHPHGVAALFVLRPGLDLGFYGVQRAAGTMVLGAVATAEEFVRSEGLLRFSATFFGAPRFKAPSRADVSKPPLADGIPELLNAIGGGGDPGLIGGLYMRTEMAPNRDSRVSLSTTSRDRLGLARVRVDWRPGPLERRTVDRSLEAIARALGRSGTGRLFSVPAHDESFWEKVVGGSHHIGTTRMHRDPRGGVVDANCRVHGIANLFVAGSSVFPTTGFANPTLTIVALALRLGRTLRRATA
jgi:choline dehydrogenase-like flavoprotein